jgi:hypothetical protein
MKYKTVKKTVPWCYDCGYEILGNGSKFLPYQCECGEWKFDDNKSDYILIKK